MKKETTVTIDRDVAARLERLSKLCEVSKKEYIAHTLTYFEKFGVNPMEHESPKTEMEKIRQRLEQVIKVIRVQQKEFTNPMFEANTALVEQNKVLAAQMAALQTETKEKIAKLVDEINVVITLALKSPEALKNALRS